jgi:hypothetical protein
MTSTPKGLIDVTAIPRDDHMSQSFLALLSKLQRMECLTHVDTEGAWAREVTYSDEQGLSRVVKNLKFLTSPQDLLE